MSEASIPTIRIEPPQPGRAFALYARRLDGFDERLQATLALLRQAAQTHAGRIVQASSLGAEDMVITDLIARHGLPVAVALIDTGRLHNETHDLRQRAEVHWDLRFEVWRPDPEAVRAFEAEHGPHAMYRSQALRHACCGLRKVEPLRRMLAGRTAWITGLRREQSDARAAVEKVALDEAGRAKYSPLADWRWADVWHYLQTHGVPYHPLHDAFMPSIGCAPCTRPIAVGEDLRAGRWWWERDALRECGLHLSGAAALPSNPPMARSQP
ncbi:Thioredoxin-dependent 5'-adenylylsulfate reductase [Tepidimonas alkaliphilus]|uniref:Adenosine 5'-phosphosulfate reductase n=1 Tax=Tepidimonas alkaliphilus TaxID=2588942 RepID=A0A554WBE5_9BURK|nr:phosphoadenylyl-sulfate reductase [Tepidimonas alkaliphilus]TSE20897.1 Thioredoxin-dependent 5'-adenylylsulfate reductase [Tepidimonas alkaliphilus]